MLLRILQKYYGVFFSSSGTNVGVTCQYSFKFNFSPQIRTALPMNCFLQLSTFDINNSGSSVCIRCQTKGTATGCERIQYAKEQNDLQHLEEWNFRSRKLCISDTHYAVLRNSETKPFKHDELLT